MHRMTGWYAMRRILIVSNEVFLPQLVGTALAGLGAEIYYISGGDAMERLCRRVLFDLILVLDVSSFLAGRNPVERVRPQGLRRPLIYVVTWQQAEQTVLSLLECGVDQYLTFPVSLARLRGKVSDELNRII